MTGVTGGYFGGTGKIGVRDLGTDFLGRGAEAG